MDQIKLGVRRSSKHWLSCQQQLKRRGENGLVEDNYQRTIEPEYKQRANPDSAKLIGLKRSQEQVNMKENSLHLFPFLSSFQARDIYLFSSSA